jgi:hypothetical protein
VGLLELFIQHQQYDEVKKMSFWDVGPRSFIDE